MQNRIRELRKEKNVTQLTLSLELGVTQETISAYETGKHLPSIISLLRLGDIFNASLDYIMGLSNIRKPISDSTLTNDEIDLLIMYQKLNPVKKERATAYLLGLSDIG